MEETGDELGCVSGCRLGIIAIGSTTIALSRFWSTTVERNRQPPTATPEVGYNAIISNKDGALAFICKCWIVDARIEPGICHNNARRRLMNYSNGSCDAAKTELDENYLAMCRLRPLFTIAVVLPCRENVQIIALGVFRIFVRTSHHRPTLFAFPSNSSLFCQTRNYAQPLSDERRNVRNIRYVDFGAVCLFIGRCLRA